MNDLNSTIDDCESSLVCTQEPSFGDIFTVTEFKEYFKNQELSDEKAKEMKNNLVGIVNSVINLYLKNFK